MCSLKILFLLFNCIVRFECRSAVSWRKWRSSKLHSPNARKTSFAHNKIKTDSKSKAMMMAMGEIRKHQQNAISYFECEAGGMRACRSFVQSHFFYMRICFFLQSCRHSLAASASFVHFSSLRFNVSWYWLLSEILFPHSGFFSLASHDIPWFVGGAAARMERRAKWMRCKQTGLIWTCHILSFRYSVVQIFVFIYFALTLVSHDTVALAYINHKHEL